MIKRMSNIDILSSGIRSDFWVLYMKPCLVDELEITKKALINCPVERVAHLQAKAMCLLEIMERPTNDIKTLLEKEKKNGSR